MVFGSILLGQVTIPSYESNLLYLDSALFFGSVLQQHGHKLPPFLQSTLANTFVVCHAIQQNDLHYRRRVSIIASRDQAVAFLKVTNPIEQNVV